MRTNFVPFNAFGYVCLICEWSASMIFNLFWIASLSPPEANGPVKIQVMFRTSFSKNGPDP